MREALLKKRFGVPALLLIGILLTAGVTAAVSVATFSSQATTAEPLTFENFAELDIVCTGESGNIAVDVSNASDSIGYGIFVNSTVMGEQVESVSYSTDNLIASEPGLGDNLNDDGDMVDAEYNIEPSGSFTIVVTIDTKDDAEPGEVLVTLNFLREHMY